MPGKLKVRILAARNLPVMDRSTELTDAFVEIKFGNTIVKTEVCKKSLNPQWNTDWYRFEVDDEDLQDDLLQIRVLDYDTYTSHDAIGKVCIDLDPLLKDNKTSTVAGWYPIYDTMHGIQGQLHVVIKIELFSDANKFRNSSCGLRIFCAGEVPQGYELACILGFVEELEVNDDPEYQWIDKIRSMRSSNEARQLKFNKLSGQLQRKIGLKVLEMGGNAILGYRQCFDLEGEFGVVVRAIGTAVILKTVEIQNIADKSLCVKKNLQEALINETGITTSPAPILNPALFPASRRLSESDVETKTPLNLLSKLTSTKLPYDRPMPNAQNIQMMEYPLFTMKTYPKGVVKSLAGVVSTFSVKLLDKIHNPEEPRVRDSWWSEIRMEICSHTRALSCNGVIGYSEHTAIHDQLVILSAYGTAAVLQDGFCSGVDAGDGLPNTCGVIGEGISENPPTDKKDTSIVKDNNECKETFLEKKRLLSISDEDEEDNDNEGNCEDRNGWHNDEEEEEQSDKKDYGDCYYCHIPYSQKTFSGDFCACLVCGKHSVPDILFCTIEPPNNYPIIGRACLIQARIIRNKKDSKNESNAKDISDSLPFAQYELHKQLVNKMKVKGMNSLFGLNIQIAIGETQLVAIATATAVFSSSLPPPGIPNLINKEDSTLSASELSKIKEDLAQVIKKNQQVYNVDVPSQDLIYSNKDKNTSLLSESKVFNRTPPITNTLSSITTPLVSTETPRTKRSGSLRNKRNSYDDCDKQFILEIDDAEDAQVVSDLMDQPTPPGFETYSIQCLPSFSPNLVCNVQMFTKLWRGTLPTNNSALNKVFDDVMKSIFFKFRTKRPCALCCLQFHVNISNEDELQIVVTGQCTGIGSSPSCDTLVSKNSSESRCQDKSEAPLDSAPKSLLPDLHSPTNNAYDTSASIISSLSIMETKRLKQHSGSKVPFGVQLSPLSWIPRSNICNHVGHLNFFIIRESASLREEGGSSCFMHSFLTEVLAICRAQVNNLGGNALLSFRLQECIIQTNNHKNQSQCLVNVYGDVVNVVYDSDSASGLSLALV